MRGHGIDQAAWLVDAVERRQDFSRDFLAQLHILFELRQQAADKHFRLALGRLGFVDQRDFGTAVAVHFAEALHGAPLLTFDQNLDRAVRQLEQLQNGRNRTYAIKCIFTGIVVSRVSLSQQKDLLVAGHRCLEGFDGFLAPHEQRDNHVRINHNITQWQERQFDGRLHDFASTAAIRP
ncbi:hypothetical protein PS685_05262 [Pseudomonas fluorescens]|uniref:Uncharacterized protein n=1 Tax=Pseudomonas fluorescens TaxID=294 RepID=A0A5E7AES4_PSEFL|nr:hypothetical protein PS685_05262 [Pseudomonas fluorescens]